MTIEEKAKAYDEAIAKAQKELQTCGSTDCDAARQIYRFFPELKESEDEKMWKLIKKYAHYNISDMALETDHITREQLESWLEKQGEEDSSIQQAYKQGYIEGQRIERKCWLEKQGQQKYIPKYKIGDYVKNTNYKGEPIYEIIYMDKECYICEYRGKERMGDKAVMHFSFDNPYLCLVQKPADKIEPKFHEGEWIVDNNGKAAIIYDLQNAGYVGHYTNGNDFVCKYDNEHLLHLWTIKDAKDGDVLAYITDEEDLWIMIYWSLYKPYEGHVHYHALLVNDSFSDKGTCCICINDLKPATKEQRDLLFAKMKKAGYEWNEKEKKLKKIGQKSAKTHYASTKVLDDCIEWIKSLKQRMEGK